MSVFAHSVDREQFVPSKPLDRMHLTLEYSKMSTFRATDSLCSLHTLSEPPGRDHDEQNDKSNHAHADSQ